MNIVGIEGAWQKLSHYKKDFVMNLKELFLNDPERAIKFSVKTPYLYFDYSRQLVDENILSLLFELARERQLSDKINNMFSGKKINITEGRAVLHVALRNISNKPIFVDGKDVMPSVNSVLEKIRKFSEEVHLSIKTGVTGKRFKNIVSIGIGGSYLGPEFLAVALKAYSINQMRLCFIANVDGADFAEKTDGLDPEETIFVVVSKTFTTAETMKNANTAKAWLIDNLGNSPEIIKRHFLAVSTAKEKVEAFGIDPENMFEFWDWVGGRYSATSAVGALPLSLYLGYDNFRKILEGANYMDEHYLNSPIEKNIPIISALIDIWNINFMGYNAKAILPYFNSFCELAPYAQQVEMESNGKSVDILGKPVDFDTGEVIFGEPATNGQHSFYQLIHQGTKIIPCDFIGFIEPQYVIKFDSIESVTHHEELMTNFFAQPDALAFGKKDEMPFKNFEGNRPTSSYLFESLNPFTAGLMLSFVEHRTATKGFIWNINSFDQFGVELGKKLGIENRERIIEFKKTGSFNQGDLNPSTVIMLEAFLNKRLPA